MQFSLAKFSFRCIQLEAPEVDPSGGEGGENHGFNVF